MNIGPRISVLAGCLALASVAFAQACPSGLPNAANGQSNVCVSFLGPQYTNPNNGHAAITFGSRAVGPYIGSYNQITPVQQYINDDYLDPMPASGTSWRTTTYSAAYVGNNFSTISGTLKYGAQIGIQGYAQLADLATWMLDLNDTNYNDTVNQGHMTVINGVNVTGDKVSLVEQALNVAMFFLTSGTRAHTDGTGGSYYIGTSQTSTDTLTALEKSLVLAEQSTFNSQTAAQNGLNSTFDDRTWVFTPTGNTNNSTKLEYWTLVTATPEGGAALAYLLLALGACFVSAYAKRRQAMAQKLV